MKKWIVISSIILIGIVTYAIYMYYYIMNSKIPNEAEAIERAKAEAAIVEVSSTSYYHGTCVKKKADATETNCHGETNAYTVITGVDDKDTEVIVFIPEEEGDVVTVEKDAGITEEEALSKVKRERNPAEIKSVRLGIDKDGKPIWEVTYIDTNGFFVYHYVVDLKTKESEESKDVIYRLPQ
jgi:uncharacterized protein YpmB